MQARQERERLAVEARLQRQPQQTAKELEAELARKAILPPDSGAAEPRANALAEVDIRIAAARLMRDFPPALSGWTSGIVEATSDDLLFPFSADNGDGLSWRVHLLPLAGRQDLYDKFHLDEPWDSKHNLTLLPEIPGFLHHPADKPGHTRFRSFLRLDG
ncbi:MAG: DUF1559 family PulG-like putative transporter, partial [Aureliella sp.]